MTELPYNELRESHLPADLRPEFKVPTQEMFSKEVQHVVLVPVSAELKNNNFANFLRQLNEQAMEHGKLGAIFLINNNPEDENVNSENFLTAQYLEFLQKRDLTGIETLAIGDEYKSLAKELLFLNGFELRFDYQYSDESSTHFGTHFGKLRAHLFKILKRLKNPTRTDDEIICHLMDADTRLSPNHFRRLEKYYADNSHQANICEFDFVPGQMEGEIYEHGDITRQMLESLDNYRLWFNCLVLNSLLLDSYVISTPAISGRLPLFLQAESQKILELSIINEDYDIAKFLRSSMGKSLGHIGEVYFIDRARHTGAKTRSDAHMRYAFTIGYLVETKRIIPELERLAREAFIDKTANSCPLTTLQKSRADILTTLRENIPPWETWEISEENAISLWIRNPAEYKKKYNSPIALVKKAIIEDIPELKEILNLADVSDEVGALPFYKHILRFILNNQHKNDQSFQRGFMTNMALVWLDDIMGLKKMFTLPNEIDDYISHSERLITEAEKSKSNFLSQSEFLQIQKEEEKTEAAKVRLRNIRLRNAIEFVVGGKTLSLREQEMVAPYIKYFGDEVETIKAKTKDGISLDLIADEITKKYSDFFDFNSNFHRWIYLVRALKRFVISHNIKVI